MSSTGLFDPPGAGFDAPFEMLGACHERVRRMLRLLARLQAHLATHGADAQAQQAARDVMRYFDLAAPAHHEDEERHVFPALLSADAARWTAVVARLRDDHARMAALWPEVRTALAAVEQARWDEQAQASAQAWRTFGALYEAHLQAEDALAFPAAQALLDAPARAAMGREMARRRGVAAPVSGVAPMP
jgi:hemerythrin-like domain-containing protein